MNKLIFTLNLVFLIIVFTGCKNDDDTPEFLNSVNENTIWKDKVDGEGIDYRLDKSISIERGKTLTIEPGVRIEIENENCQISVYGTLKMIGTSEKPIILESKNKVPGSWIGIFLKDLDESQIIMDHVIINYAGKKIETNFTTDYFAVTLKTLRFCSVKNCTISGSGNNGILLFSDSVEFANNSIINCVKAPVVCRLNHLNNLDTLSNYKDGNGEAYIKIDKESSEVVKKIEAFPLNVPYRISSNQVIKFPFYIKPGCVFEMDSYTGIYTDPEFSTNISHGFINAEGEPGKRIVFKGSTDGKGTWSSISFFNKSENNRLIWCDISGAGANVGMENYGWAMPGDTTAIAIGNTNIPARVVVNYCSLSESSGWAIKVKKGSEPYLENNKYSNNKLGDVFYEK